MRTSASLDRIIHENPDPGARARGDAMQGTPLIVDVKRKEVLPSKPYFTLGRELRYWLVRTEQSAEGRLPIVEVRDFSTNRALSLSVRYEAYCPAGAEHQVALTLGQTADPTAQFHHYMGQWVQAFARKQKNDKRDFIAEYFELRVEWQNSVAAAAQELTGLIVDVHLAIKDEDQLRTVKIAQKQILVRVKDFDGDVPMIFDADLEVDQRSISTATLNLDKLPGIESAIGEQIRRLMREEPLHKVCYGLTDGPAGPGGSADLSIRAKVRRAVEVEVAKYGRELSFFALQPGAINWLPERTYTIMHPVSCTLQQYPQPIAIEHTLLLELEDAGRFMAHRIGDVCEWARKQLTEITRNEFFETSYVDLLLKFAQSEERIKEAVLKRAKEIGFERKQLILLPVLKEFEWNKKGFPIEINEAEFATKVPEMVVKLSVLGSARIQDLNDRRIRSRIDRNANIPEEVKAAVKSAAAAVLHRTEPQRFYMDFTASKQDGEPEKGVEHELRQAITAKLETFGLTDIDFVVKQVETKLKRRHDDLLKGTHVFHVDVLSYREKEAPEAVRFIIEFKVRGVDENGWTAFQANDYATVEEEIEAVKQTFQRDVEDKFKSMPLDYLRWESYRIRTEIESKVVVPSTRKIATFYGLDVQVVNFSRDPTFGAKLNEEKLKKMLAKRVETDVAIDADMEDSRRTELAEAKEKRRKLLDGGDYNPNDPEVRAVDKYIKDREKKHDSRTTERHRAALEGPKLAADSTFSLDDYAFTPPAAPPPALPAPRTSVAKPRHAEKPAIDIETEVREAGEA